MVVGILLNAFRDGNNIPTLIPNIVLNRQAVTFHLFIFQSSYQLLIFLFFFLLFFYLLESFDCGHESASHLLEKST